MNKQSEEAKHSSFRKKEEKSLLKPRNFKQRIKPNGTIEARCYHNGTPISISAKTQTQLRKKIALKIAEVNRIEKSALQAYKEENQRIVPIFREYALKFLKIIKKDEISASWYDRQAGKLKNHIFPFIGEKRLDVIKPFDCQEVLNALYSVGKYRTGEDIYNLMNNIFAFAVEDDFIKKNPMNRIKFRKSERVRGRCMTYEEEAELLEYAKGTRYFPYIVLMLYAGLRPCECHTARIDGDFIIANNAKRKQGKKEEKFIPITPMMRPYLPLLTEIEDIKIKSLQMWFLDLPIKVHAYLCRHTFNTRLFACGISQEYRELAMGHRSSAVNVDTYTHYEMVKKEYFDEFQKVNYVEKLKIPSSFPKK